MLHLPLRHSDLSRKSHFTHTNLLIEHNNQYVRRSLKGMTRNARMFYALSNAQMCFLPIIVVTIRVEKMLELFIRSGRIDIQLI